ncbi:MAG: TrmH family RNA methyltransferase [Caldilineaceae bacterium]
MIIVLDQPQNPANIGAVVRAMRNFGFTTLRLVNPAPFARTDLLRYAHRCDDLVAAMTIHPSLDEALADAVYVVGTAAQAHPERPHTRDIHALARSLHARAGDGPVALLFGTEGDGLDRAALDRCHLIASLPTEADYPALNLAQSVLLFLYEMRQNAPASSTPPPSAAADTTDPAATQADLERLFAATESLLTDAGYIRYSPEALMRTVRQLVYRARLSQRETGILLGMARTLQRRLSADPTAAYAEPPSETD